MNFSTSANAGDCQWSLLFLRKLGGEHRFYCKPEYVDGMRSLMTDKPSIYIGPLSEWDGKGYDTWVANAQFETYGVVWRCQQDVMGFVMDYFNAMARQIAGVNVFNSREDLLWDNECMRPNVREKLIDCLIVSSDPLSGQCPEYSRSELSELVTIQLTARYGRVIRTNEVDGAPVGYTLAEIGAMAAMSKRIICVATGASWPTFNVWAKDTPRIVILDPMRLDMGCTNIHHAKNAEEVRRIATTLGWL